MREIGQDTRQNATEGHQCVHMPDVLADMRPGSAKSLLEAI